MLLREYGSIKSLVLKHYSVPASSASYQVHSAAADGSIAAIGKSIGLTSLDQWYRVPVKTRQNYKRAVPVLQLLLVLFWFLLLLFCFSITLFYFVFCVCVVCLFFGRGVSSKSLRCSNGPNCLPPAAVPLLFEPPGDSLFDQLKRTYPDHEWLEWKFLTVPNGFWDIRANRLRYVEWAAKQCGVTKLDDWYSVPQKDFAALDSSQHVSQIVPYAGECRVSHR